MKRRVVRHELRTTPTGSAREVGFALNAPGRTKPREGAKGAKTIKERKASSQEQGLVRFCASRAFLRLQVC